MIALLKRFLKSIQFRGVFGHFFGNVVVRSVATMATAGAAGFAGFAGPGLLWLAFMLLLAVVMLIVLMVRTPLPRRAKWCAEAVEPLVGSDEQYCLLLRPFGYDGRLVLPDVPSYDPGLPWWRRPAAGGPVQRTKPIEQVIADSVRTALVTSCWPGSAPTVIPRRW